MATYERASTFVASKTPVRWDIVDSTDVIIVGTSITSLTLAVDLARRGVSFVLLKTNLTRSTDVEGTSIPEDEVLISNTCGENFGIFGLQPRSLEVYEDLGVIEAILAKATPLRGERMIIDGQVCLDWNYDADTLDSHYKLPVTIEQCEVERILLEKLVELGYGDCIKGPVDVLGVSESGPKVWCRYRAVMPLTDVFLNPLETPHSTPSQAQCFDSPPVHNQFISGKYLVGCDGSNSVVRRHLGIPYPGCAVSTARFVIADAVMDWGISPDTDKVSLLFCDGYATIAMHLKDNIWRLTIISQNAVLASQPKADDAQSTRSTKSGTSTSTRSPHTPPMRPGQSEADDASSVAGSTTSRSSTWQHNAADVDSDVEVAPPTREDMTFLMQRVVPDAVCTELLWCSWTPIISRCCPTFHKGRSYLAGDAAHIIPPLFMQGLNTGIQDAHNIGWKLAQVIKEESTPALLQTYTTERQPINFHLRLFATLPGRQIAEGNMWIFKFFKHILPHMLDIKSVNQAMTRKLSQTAIQYSRGVLVGSRRVSSGLRPGQRCPDGMITHLHSTGELSFTRLHQVLSGPQHIMMVLLHLPTISDTLATMRAANDGKKRISDTRLMELLLDDVLSFMAEMTNLLRPKSSRSEGGGVKNVMVLTSGKPLATPALPAVTGTEATEDVISHLLANPSQHAAQFATYINKRYTVKNAAANKDADFCLGWDSECEITNHFNWKLSPQPQASLMSVMQTMSAWTKASSTQAIQDGTADSRDMMDAITSRFGSKYGAFALIRPDGHTSHTGYLSDYAARNEATGFAQQYLCAKQT